MTDIEVMDDEIQARLKAQISELVTVESAETIDEAKVRAVTTPAAFTMHGDEKSEGRKVSSRRSQVEDHLFVVGTVTSSYRSKRAALKGAKGAYAINQAVKKALVDFKPTGALTPLIFVGKEYVDRVGDRLLFELTFRTQIYETYD